MNFELTEDDVDIILNGIQCALNEFLGPQNVAEVRQYINFILNFPPSDQVEYIMEDLVGLEKYYKDRDDE